MNKEKKYVYLFNEGNASMNNLLGGKGAGLAEMSNIGLNVPPGFTITTEACIDFLERGKFPEGMWEQTLEKLRIVEDKTGKKFGGNDNPLLVSVRSGAPISMPGMMDTILNVGLNDSTLDPLKPSIGLNSSRFLMVWKIRLRSVSFAMDESISNLSLLLLIFSFRPNISFIISSGLGKNSCRGGSSSLIITGYPSMVLKNSTKS